MHLSQGKPHSQMCWRLRWLTSCMAKKQTCVTFTDVQVSNGRVMLSMHHAQIRDRWMPDQRILQQLHCQFSGTGSIHFTRLWLLFMEASIESFCSHIRSCCQCAWNNWHLRSCTPVALPTLSIMQVSLLVEAILSSYCKHYTCQQRFQ